jgi:thiol:disulfide interchange protein DsbD
MQNITQKLLLVSILFSTLLFGGFDTAIKKQKFLSPDEAFQLSAVKKDGTIHTKIKMADKIHIYEDSLHYRIVSPEKFELHPDKPAPQEFDGDKVYQKELDVAIPANTIEEKVKGDYTLEIEFQGCSDAGICYQPIKKRFAFEGAKAGFFDKIGSALKEGNASKIADLLSHESGIFIVLLFFLFGIFLSLTPCIFPMIPILSSIIVSQQKGQEQPSVTKAFFTSLVYVLAMALTYTVVGVIAGVVGADIQTAMQNPWVLTAFAAMFVALAFSLFGYYEIGLPASWQSRLSRVSDEAGQKGGLVGTAVMGLLSALIVGPCVAPPLAGAVLFISHTGDAVLGGTALFVMSLGMGLPLLLVGIGAGKFMPKPGGWMTAVSQAFGVMMLALAIFMLSRILPDGVTMMLWSILFIGTAIYMGVFESKAGEGAMKLFRIIAMLFLLYGAALFVGALSGADSIFRPFERFTAPKGTVTVANQKNHRGYSIERLLKEVAASEKPVVVDFGKESCTACKELEEITFPDPKVKEALKRFTFIKVDVTDNTDAEKALLKKYELFGTPNIIFFDKNGKYMPEKSLTGFVKPEDFTSHLEGIGQ